MKNLKSLILLSIIVFVYSKHYKQQKRNHINERHARIYQEERKTPRFIIPKPDALKSTKEENKPEQINIVKKSGTIKDNALPGAYGEDYSLTESDESDNDSGSGSGSGNDAYEPTIKQHFTSVTHDKKAETAANFGNNVEPKAGINPTSAFITESQNHAGFKGSDKTIEKKKTKKNKKSKKTKKVNNKKGKVLTKTKAGNTRSLEKKKGKSDHGKDLDIMAQIKNIEKKLNEVEKKKGKKHNKNTKSKNLKQKVSSYIKQLEHDISNEMDDDENSNANKMKTNSKKQKADEDVSKTKVDMNHANITTEVEDGSGVEEEKQQHEEADQKDEMGKINTRVDVAQAGSPEGFECPWICFWTCHSYCPKECCNNPFHCPRQCKEFCTPYCSENCCAPGSRRMPKLQINFHDAAETGKKDNTSLVVLKNKTMEIQKAQNETNQIAKQLEALKQASFYAAQALGLPNSCPLFCPQICTPGLCKPECCSRSDTYKLPRIVKDNSPPLATKPVALPGSAPAGPPAPPPAAPQTPAAAAVPPPQPAQQVGKPAPVPASAPAAATPAGQLPSAAIAAAMQAVTQGAQTTGTAGSTPLDVVSSYQPLSAKEQAASANIKGEKIGEFTITQPNGQPQTFNVESGPITVVPDGSSGGTAATNEQIKTEQTAYVAPENAQEPPQQTQALPSTQKATQRFVCPTPINCPEGATVDPDYCPPICRTACIEQCPNECCPNYGKQAPAKQ